MKMIEKKIQFKRPTIPHAIFIPLFPLLLLISLLPAPSSSSSLCKTTLLPKIILYFNHSKPRFQLKNF
jgi:hypothetical protein